MEASRYPAMEKAKKIVTTILKNHRTETAVLLAILLLAAFLRLYKIREFGVFLGDEGRDALVVKRMIVDHKFTLLGPTASVGGFYLGPIYYYFMIPFLGLSNFDPVGPAVMVALFGIATVGLLYWAVREWIGPSFAAIAALLYATAPGVVAASRSSWNPNIMPFFALLSVFGIAHAIEKKKPIWFVIAGIAYGIAIQSHYLGLILGPILAVTTLVSIKAKFWLKAAALQILGFLIGGSMFFAFEVRHNFPTIKTIIEFICRGGNTTGPRSWNLISLFLDMLKRTYESVLSPTDDFARILMYTSAIGFIALLVIKKRSGKPLSVGIKTILVWLIVGELGIGAYKGQLYPHYFGFLFPLPFILIGTTLGLIIKKRMTKILGIGVSFALVALNLTNQDFWRQGSNLIDQTKNIAVKIIEVSEQKPFNLALIADGNSDHAYRYFLESMGHRPNTLEEEVTEQLIVVCEHPDKPCEPRGHPLWEIAGFGRAEIAARATVYPGIRILKLTHHADSQNLIGKPVPKGK